MPEPSAGLRLEGMVLLGRTFDEYRRMFDLDTVDPALPILDVAAGVSSFCAEATAAGYRVTASDQVYQFSAEVIATKCAQDLALVLNQLPRIMHLYRWQVFQDVEELKRQRERAYSLFVEDFKLHGRQRYVPVTYPPTNFAKGQFAISLVSHLLFLYDAHLDYDFHRQTIAELLRITWEEIRIFPLISLDGMRSRFLEPLVHDSVLAGCWTTIRAVDYEFMRGGNEMLVISKRPLPR